MTMNDTAGVHRSSPAQAKIALFRSLFRGREDIWPRRFESLRTGKSGYAPACANEWRPGVCEKPRIKCAVCPHRQFLPVTDDVIRWHLTGADDAGAPFTMGVYPMLRDETCHFLAVDFDGKTLGGGRIRLAVDLHQTGSARGARTFEVGQRRSCVAVLRHRRGGRSRAPLVLTERIDHLEVLAGGLRAIGASVVVLRGGMGSKQLEAALARAAEHVPGQVLLATGRFIREGFDNARLDTLFLTMPVSWRGTIFRRLQGLPETRDRFHVNERLPIPFSEDGRMEVDFLDPKSKLVIELDGAQHLADPEAYRRDRRKDALLQEHGYLVLRFLAEDLGTRLDAVLDEVLRALAGRTRRSGAGGGR